MLFRSLTERATLHPLEPWQAAEFAALVDRARPHLAPWLPWARSITDQASAHEFLQRYADAQARDTGRIYGLRLDGNLVGGTLFRVFNAVSGVCEIGVWLAPEAEGQGLITRAVEAMIDWAVHERGMSRIEWLTVPANHRSQAVARRLGMRRDGVLRQAFPLGGERYDVEVWSLLAAEWRGVATPSEATT
ncbi:GNAT family protein [Micromonospora purpureochromogenes]|uniref:GNAT family N-acetyltransferase n=1 Tax=Micromonospora purpureochromogenes TaxID=47872 RepID=UPI00332775D4